MRRFGPEKVLVLPLELLNHNPVSFVTRILQFCNLTAAETAINNLPFRRRVRPSHSSFTLNLQRPFNFMFGEQTSFNPRSVFPLNRSKKLFDRWSRRIDGLLPDLVRSRYQQRAEAIVAAAVRDYFADSNRITSELTGLPLAEYGYDSPEISADMAC